jgi:hypothetical protein
VRNSFPYRTSIVGLALGGLACASSQPPVPVPDPETSQLFEERLEEPYLPVRTEFTVTLDEAIGTRIAARDVRAHIRHPVRSPENEIVLQSEARLRGRIVSIEEKPALTIKLKFDDVDTVWGSAPLVATIRSAEPYASASPGMGDGSARYDATLRLPTSAPVLLSDGRPPLNGAAVGGGPSSASDAIFLPKGAELRVQLLRPLVPPRNTTYRR